MRSSICTSSKRTTEVRKYRGSYTDILDLLFLCRKPMRDTLNSSTQIKKIDPIPATFDPRILLLFPFSFLMIIYAFTPSFIFAAASVIAVVQSKSNTWIRWSVLRNDPAPIISRSAPLIIGCREVEEHQMSLLLKLLWWESSPKSDAPAPVKCKIRLRNMPAPEGRFECSNDRGFSSHTVVDT